MRETMLREVHLVSNGKYQVIEAGGTRLRDLKGFSKQIEFRLIKPLLVVDIFMLTIRYQSSQKHGQIQGLKLTNHTLYRHQS